MVSWCVYSGTSGMFFCITRWIITPAMIMTRMIAAPSINPPVSPDLRGSSPCINIGVIVGVGSGVDWRALICLGRLNPVSTINANRSPKYNNWRGFLVKDLIQGISLNIRGIIPKSGCKQCSWILGHSVNKKRPVLPGRVEGGGGGIRTHDSVRNTRSPSARTRPDYATPPRLL